MTELTDKQFDRLETAYKLYRDEYHETEVRSKWEKAGGKSYLADYYEKAIAEGIADRITGKNMKEREELYEAIGVPEK